MYATENGHGNDQERLWTFDELPIVPGLPKGCAWTLFDRDGKKDELGTLNYLTPETVRGALSEAREGLSVSLNWSLSKPAKPVFGRKGLHHSLIDNSTFSSSLSFDDEIAFNTQSSSQWDGLRHVIHRQTGTFYNNIGKEQITSPMSSDVLGLQKWHDRGGIVGRGVLIDYVAYAKRHGINYSPIEYHAISHKDLENAATEQGVEFRKGDILLVRTGLIKWYNECVDVSARDAYFEDAHKAGVGVDPNLDTVAWVWNHHFAAVAGDALAWEPIPYPQDRLSFHQYLLSLWGTPIGELWDLERLAETCARLGRYSFLLTSISLNIPGAVASPPNALAIF